MPSTTQRAVRTYVDAWLERDPAVRARHLEASFGNDGRVRFPSRELRGRAAVLAEMEAFHGSGLRARLVSIIECHGAVFRFRSRAENAEGRSFGEFLDVGEVYEHGLIAWIVVFPEPLAPAESQ
jgi:hypothetical protein